MEKRVWKTGSVWVLVVCFMLAFSGCFTMGKDFSSGMVKTIQQGKTTRSTILDVFGAYEAKGIENGQETWTYSYYQFRVFGWEAWTKDLTIHFDNKDIVSSYSYSSTWPPNYQ